MLSLLLSSALWHIYTKLSYTDMLLAGFVVAAVWLLHRDLGLSVPNQYGRLWRILCVRDND